MDSASAEEEARPAFGEAKFGLPRSLRWSFSGGMAGFFAVVGFALLHAFPARFFDGDWLVSEHGNQLYRAQLIASGLIPYRDFECQYGPLPLYLWSVASRWLGNTAQGCAAYHVATSALVIGALAGWLSAAVQSRKQLLGLGLLLGIGSLAQTVLFLNPMVLCTGVNVEYLSLERLWLIGIAMLWRMPLSRTWGQAIGIGILFLLCQLSKFGGGLYAVCALGAVDVLYFLCFGNRRVAELLVRSWVRTGLCVVGAEAIRSVVFFLLLPAPLAVRTLWPFWVVATYPNDFLTLWDGWKHLLVFTLPIWCPLALGASIVVGLLVPGWRRRILGWIPVPQLFPVLVLWGFFVGGMVYRVGYFHREWQFFQYEWTLLPLVLLCALSFRPWGGVMPLIVYSISAMMFLRSLTAPQKRSKLPIASWSGRIGTVYLPPYEERVRAWTRVHAWLAGHPGVNFCVMDSWSGGAWYAELGQRSLFRNHFFAPGARSADDQAEFSSKLPQLDCVLIALDSVPPHLEARMAALRRLLAMVHSEEIGDRLLADFHVELEEGVWTLLARSRGTLPGSARAGAGDR